MISIEISKEAILNKRVLEATINLLQLLGQDMSDKVVTSSHVEEPSPTSSQTPKRPTSPTRNKDNSRKKSRRRGSAKKSTRDPYHLPKSQLMDWISSLEAQQRLFVTLLMERGQLSLEEITQEVGLILDPNKDKVKMINGFVGSIARWSSKSLKKSQKLIVPWECKDKLYTWRGDLLGQK